MAKSFDGNLDILRDFDTFVFGRGQINQRDLDELAKRFVAEKVIIEKYRTIAIQEFRLAVITSALTARSVYLIKEDRGRGVAAFKEEIKALRKVRLDSVAATVPGYEGNVLQYRREIEAAKRHLDNAIAAADLFSELRIQNYRNTDIFKHTFVQNLGICWERLTGKRPPRSDAGPFAEFVRKSFLALKLPDKDPGYYAKVVFSRKKIPKDH